MPESDANRVGTASWSARMTRSTHLATAPTNTSTEMTTADLVYVN